LLKIYLERTQLLLHFTPFQKEELVISPISRISVIEAVFLFHVIQPSGNERGGTPGGAVHMHDSEKARN